MQNTNELHFWIGSNPKYSKEYAERIYSLLDNLDPNNSYGEDVNKHLKYSIDCKGRKYSVEGKVMISEIYFPLKKDKWPHQFVIMEKSISTEMTWPYFSTYCCAMDLMDGNIASMELYYGYAMHDDTLIKCSFYVYILMEDENINGTILKIPHSYVIDPLADKNGIYPECYIGRPINKEFTENWLFGDNEVSPLEAYIRQIEKRLTERQEREEEFLQYSINLLELKRQLSMSSTCNNLPPELIAFAKKHKITIPDNQNYSGPMG